MELKKDWLTNGIIDLEYKRYILLAYFQRVQKSFSNIELYPILSDLIDHYQSLKSIKEEKIFIRQNFPLSLTQLDLEKLQLKYEELVNDDKVMAEIQEIIDYAFPLFKNHLKEGKEIYEFVESHCELSPVGLLPLYTREGYFLIREPRKKEIPIYRYEVTVFENSHEKLRGIHARMVESIHMGIGQTYENIKVQLARKFKELPNPAVFLINTKMSFPLYGTVVPVAKRLLVRYIASSG